ncbi:aminopeptidase P family protein [Romboutsia weinsteinii]|uniref:Aminopeptidase P family protein n=1 Tax=Romboutsia weinsteinii TaxID=2020949 RepID=A0A371J5D5_9FIRM|nr:Xaa-Pro peptidase family protein [Romboutsia weinsteinii]RDY27904.1 aminopeptidase P family protein [Romboutsia weinsteinii]
MKIQRLNAVIEQMKKDNIPQMLVTDPTAIFYLTGQMIHPGERLIALYLNTSENHKFFINKLFPVYEDLVIEKVWFTDVDDGLSIITENVDKNALMGVDKNWPARFLLRLMELKGGSTFINSSYIIDTLRMCKDDEEKDLMRKASALNDEAMQRLKATLPAGFTEKQLAGELSKIYEEIGADGFSFKPIVGFGANGADPHASAGNAFVKEGDAVIFDIGCVKDHYCSDMTRTVFYKSAPKKAREVFEIVLEANKRAISLVKPGIRFCDIDAAARNYITEKGYGKYFTHRTGHSIGLEVHDMGDVSSTNTNVLKPGMIFSVEPGIYLPGEFGVRIEDLIMVTEDGYENLNKHDKELCIIG